LDAWTVTTGGASGFTAGAGGATVAPATCGGLGFVLEGGFGGFFVVFGLDIIVSFVVDLYCGVSLSSC
jgi:hypothetical protein